MRVRRVIIRGNRSYPARGLVDPRRDLNSQAAIFTALIMIFSCASGRPQSGRCRREGTFSHLEDTTGRSVINPPPLHRPVHLSQRSPPLLANLWKPAAGLLSSADQQLHQLPGLPPTMDLAPVTARWQFQSVVSCNRRTSCEITVSGRFPTASYKYINKPHTNI